MALPVTVVTGFLGSGKTSFIARLLACHSLQAAVIVNEAGKLGIDDRLLRPIAQDVRLLPSGCLCCSPSSNVVQAVDDLIERRDAGSLPPFDRIIIETSGLADPSLTLESLVAAGARGRVRLAGLITIVDAKHGAACLTSRAEARQQTALADRLVFTKLDLATRAQTRATLAATRWLSRARRSDGSHGRTLDAQLLDVSLFRADGTADLGSWLPNKRASCSTDSQHGVAILTRSIETPLAWEDFSRWLDLLLAALGDDLLRLKAVLDIGDGSPVAVHAVHRTAHQPARLLGWDAQPSSKIVLIVDETAAPAFDQALHCL